MRAHLVSSTVALAFLVQGCIIGTWPTPEDRSKNTDVGPSPPDTALAPETCDGRDNDADGAVDEGCACDVEARGCVGIESGLCGLGVQWCVDGIWDSCVDLGPPFVPAQQPRVNIVEVAPTSLTRGATEYLTVRAEPVPACPGIAVHTVEAQLEASVPQMLVRASARDDGLAPDLAAGDNEFAGTLPNVFGPGVPAQALTVRVIAAIAGTEVSAVQAVPLVEP